MSRLTSLHDEPHGDVEERAMWWALLLSQMVMVSEDLYDVLPEECNLIALPEEDAALCAHNFILAQKSKGLKVFVGIKREGDCSLNITPFQGTNTYTFAS